jgi:acetylcholinesterase
MPRFLYQLISDRTGDLRFNLPVPNTPYAGSHSAITFGPACPQQAITLPIVGALAPDAVNFLEDTIFQVVSPSSEDCEH